MAGELHLFHALEKPSLYCQISFVYYVVFKILVPKSFCVLLSVILKFFCTNQALKFPLLVPLALLSGYPLRVLRWRFSHDENLSHCSLMGTSSNILRLYYTFSPVMATV